jgi:hypothetical protein
MLLYVQIKVLQNDILQLRMDKQMLAREQDLHQRVFLVYHCFSSI